ncbi:hypothetical protein K491DRAFT_734525 [Lophiostoma macrostomum CBS 122681]|uniref:RBR-type E3 ubiquitin transferase n=1 Tax=Lophiostoma macrostomum CBS 122681 TaxID=1314788 RepID=A0A6A6SPI3_9PLEO|nr:hypothetical protein K491DRAFT_734525 [Lophiostoma macrostomum CBS 122681]
MSATLTVQPAHPAFLEDDITALTLQLEEINYREETKKGKHAVDNLPDLEVAYVSYLHEIEAHLAFLKDVKLAHSIAHAVDIDGQAIQEISRGEVQAQEDRRYAMRISSDDPELEAPPPYTEELRDEFIEDEVTLYEDPAEEAGPSVPYAQRQAEAMGRLSREAFECVSCREDFRWDAIHTLGCGDQYCDSCLRRHIMQPVTERKLNFLPPRCHGTAVARGLIEDILSASELGELDDAQLEKDTEDKTYCSNVDCGKFIAPIYIRAGDATCPRCDTKTCSLCKNQAHQAECPEDPEVKATLDLGEQRHWQRCYSCRAMVEIDWGCNHMTCLCGAQFCYLCGTRWHECRCAFWIEENLVHRAEEVVDRAAANVRLQPAERQRRVHQMQEELRDTDECEHRGRKKFTMINYGRFQCEMCGTRHRKFILRCKRCQLDLCADCRRHGV